MKKSNTLRVGLATLLLVCTASASADDPKIVIPFDFTSKFDQGRYGQTVGEMILAKLRREGGFVLPESMLDVRDTVAANRIVLEPDTPLEKVKQVVVGEFGAQIGIWGSVERVPGNEWDAYDLKIRCVDFSTQPEPTVIYRVDARTKAVSEIPHVYVKALVDRLCGRQPGGPPPVDAAAEENWQKGPNLVRGGDFQQGRAGVPDGWEARGGQLREPLGNLVQWLPETGNPANRVIRLQFDQALGDSFGVMYYSDFFPVEEGATYRFQCRWRTSGPEAKVFIKCYDEVESPPSASGPKATAGDDPTAASRRECYRSQQNLKGPKKTWNTHAEDFTPRHTKYTPRWGRVMLYGYLGAGAVEFDDVVVKQIVPASPGESAKTRRHSLETRTTLKEMEENRRRSEEMTN
ncbi:MAG: hypothetical protein JW809_03670 [Pirellulales bacterium]|nr:hypothetical protein [Pirellulales bacterium]